jgi:hypothetical protein
MIGMVRVPKGPWTRTGCGHTVDCRFSVPHRGNVARPLGYPAKRTAGRFRLASTSGVRFRYSRQKEAARGCGGRGMLWEFNRFLPEKPCQTGTLAKTILLIFTI